MYSSPEILDGIHENLVPLYSLVMSKNHSKVELVATDKTTKHNYQMKKVSYPNLPILQNYKVIIKCSIKFPSVIGGFATPFSLKQILDKVKFQAIVTDLYKFLTNDDLQTIKLTNRIILKLSNHHFLQCAPFI